MIRKSPAKKNKTVEFNEQVTIADDSSQSEPSKHVSAEPLPPTHQQAPVPAATEPMTAQPVVKEAPAPIVKQQQQQVPAEAEKTADQLIREELGETSEISGMLSTSFVWKFIFIEKSLMFSILYIVNFLIPF